MKFRNGVQMEIRTRTSDAAIVAFIWIDHDYLPRGWRIDEHDIVLDIGAQIGAFTVMAARMAKRGRVLAFEPEPTNYQLLKKNVILNKLGNVVAYEEAVSGKGGFRSLRLNSKDTGGHTFFSYMPAGQCLEVPSESLLEIVRNEKLPRIDFLKIDAEGAEYEILFGSTEETLRKVKRISMEAHWLDKERNPSALSEFLKTRGFKVCTELKHGGDFLVHAER